MGVDTMETRSDITRLLIRFGDGDRDAFERVIPLVYDELRTIARRYVGGSTPETLNATALVHEAYVRLVDQTRVEWASRDRFLAVCSVVMRNLVIDLARSRKTEKRGGDRQQVELNENTLAIDQQADELIALDQALERLAEFDPALVRVVECRYFTGLTEAETASALEIGERTVRRHWVKAKALLRQILDEPAEA